MIETEQDYLGRIKALTEVVQAQRELIAELRKKHREELDKANAEIKRLDNENSALSKMLTSAALQGRQGW